MRPGVVSSLLGVTWGWSHASRSLLFVILVLPASWGLEASVGPEKGQS